VLASSSFQNNYGKLRLGLRKKVIDSDTTAVLRGISDWQANSDAIWIGMLSVITDTPGRKQIGALPGDKFVTLTETQCSSLS
jgi:hypothetical protein